MPPSRTGTPLFFPSPSPLTPLFSPPSTLTTLPPSVPPSRASSRASSSFSSFSILQTPRPADAAHHHRLSQVLRDGLWELPQVGNVAANGNSRVLSRVGTPVVPGDDDLRSLGTVDTSASNFRWLGKRYFLTWAQIGDVPNDAIAAHISAMTHKVEGKSLVHSELVS